MERELFYPLDHFPNDCDNQGWDSPKLGAVNFFQSSMWVQGPKTLGHPLLLSQAVTRETDRKRSNQDLNQCLYRVLALQV